MQIAHVEVARACLDSKSLSAILVTLPVHLTEEGGEEEEGGHKVHASGTQRDNSLLYRVDEICRVLGSSSTSPRLSHCSGPALLSRNTIMRLRYNQVVVCIRL